MFENVIFFSDLHLKFTKSAILTPKKLLRKNINMGIKNAQNFMLISNSFKFVDSGFQKCSSKSY